MKKDGDQLMKDIVRCDEERSRKPEVQALVQRHYDALRFFYEPNPEMYQGLADMYVATR